MTAYPTPPAPRRSKAESLRLAERLKRTVAAGAMLSFGGLSLVVGNHIAATSAHAATSTNSSSTQSSSSASSSQSSGTSSSSSSFSTSPYSSPSTSTGVS